MSLSLSSSSSSPSSCFSKINILHSCQYYSTKVLEIIEHHLAATYWKAKALAQLGRFSEAKNEFNRTVEVIVASKSKQKNPVISLRVGPEVLLTTCTLPGGVYWPHFPTRREVRREWKKMRAMAEQVGEIHISDILAGKRTFEPNKNAEEIEAGIPDCIVDTQVMEDEHSKKFE